PLHVARLERVEVALGVDLEEAADLLALLVAHLPIRRDGRGDRDDAVAREELRDVADAADVGVAVLLAEAEALAERRAELVAVEQLDAHAALEQIVLDALGERRLAGAGEPGEPEGEAFHRRRSFHLVFIASIRIFAISGRENSGGGIEPARSMSRTCVPESST